MASADFRAAKSESTTASGICLRRYKVFLSFSGGDNRSFVSDLCKRLEVGGNTVFRDENVEKGESVDLSLLQAIEDSRVAVVLLSKNYASSTWCLDELAKIVDCMGSRGLEVVPVFYGVDRSDVQKQTGEIGAAFSEHEKYFAKDRVQKWKKALAKVAYLSGWDFRLFRDDSAFVDEIVQYISTQLLCGSSDATDLVGMKSHVSEMEKLLEIQKNDVRMVGILGVGGIGKTTIASVIYDKLYTQFDGGCFLKNVGERFRKDGLPSLRKELLCKTLKEENQSLPPLDRDSNVIKDNLGRMAVLIVVDDPDESEQLECLANRNWFGLGSRIIITTRDKQLLAAHRVEHVYEVPCLDDDQSRQLFNRYAFRQKQPEAGYSGLSNSFLSKVYGLPLGLIVMASFLRGKERQVWESVLDRLCKYPNLTIQTILETCYSGLNHMEKEAFLDIAFFFNGWKEHSVRHFLDACGFRADTTLTALKDKALITTSGNILCMHKLLQETGLEIIRKESSESAGPSRLSDFKDMECVLSKSKEAGKVEVICLDTAEEIIIRRDAFTGMNKLRVLIFRNSSLEKCNLVVEDLSSLPSSLRLLHFPGYPLESLPSTFCPKFLVELILPHSSIRKLWPGKQTLEHLILIDLSHSKYLTELPDLSEAHNLQRLNLENCSDLVDVSSIEHLTNFQYLNFRNCEKLDYLPDMTNLELLKELYLSNCSSLVKIRRLPANIEYLYVNGTAIEELPLPTGCPLSLIELDVRNCIRLATLPRQLSSMKSLKVDIDGCPLLLDSLSSATGIHGRCHDVYLSFRDVDSKRGFVSQLSKALELRGVRLFRDEGVKRGEFNSPSILRAIEDSKVALVFISKNYISSQWCLDELVKISDCRNSRRLVIVPIFFYVDPLEMLEQTGEIGAALCQLENDFNRDRVRRWREALSEVSCLSGWDYSFRDEDIFIEKLANDIFDQLIWECSGDSTCFVGMSYHVSKIDELLEIRKDIVRMVGISGIGGIGKTTIARVIYDRLFNQFDGGCFLEDVGYESCKRGLPELREELLCKTLKVKDLSLWPLDLDSNMIKDRLGRKKVLIVLDDVDEIEQLEYLVKPDYFDLGSRIIITTRNRQLLLAHGVEYIYEVPRLEHYQALHLFCRYAFRQNQPKQGFLELSNSFLSKVDGVPLALKVLGSFLYERSCQDWVSKLDRLNKFPKTDIQKVLEIGYFGQDDKVREVFLDIAFCFGGGNEQSVRSIIDCCLSDADISLKVFKDIILPKTSANKVFMYELLREIASEIVRRESRDPVKRGGWSFEDVNSCSSEIICLVGEPKETLNLEDIFLNILTKYKICLHLEAFMRLDKLSYQVLPESMFSCFIQQCLPESLFLCSIPQRLIELKLENNYVEELWEGEQDFVNLQLMELKGTKLTKLPDLSRAMKLKKLILRACINMIDVSSIQGLAKLGYLALEGCKKLKTLPCMTGLKSLETLTLKGCSSLVELPDLSTSIKSLSLVKLSIDELPGSMGNILGLEKLDLRNCERLKRVPSSIAQLKFLKSINISGCTILLRFRSEN